MCTWSRIDRLPRILDILAQQTMRIHLAICNNNAEASSQIRDILTQFSHPNLRTSFFVSGSNLGGFARFLVARELYQTEHMGYVMFLDDDVELGPTAVETLWNAREPMSFVTVYGKLSSFPLLSHLLIGCRSNVVL